MRRDATVTYTAPADASTRVVTLQSAVPEHDVSLDHIRAMCRLLLDVVVEVAGGGTANRMLTLSAAADAAHAVTLDQVGGLDEIVGNLRQIAVSFRHPEVMARWGARRPQGLLLYGPPGTGKTMLARALTHEIGARFQEVHTPDILDKWLGASERNIKRIFRDARRYREPTVMLFDEFDSIISYAGAAGDSAGQAINAVAGLFKQEMNDLIDANSPPRPSNTARAGHGAGPAAATMATRRAGLRPPPVAPRPRRDSGVGIPTRTVARQSFPPFRRQRSSRGRSRTPTRTRSRGRSRQSIATGVAAPPRHRRCGCRSGLRAP
jgi:hypothetical protein